MADNTIKDPAEYQNEEENTNQAVSWKSPSSSNRSYGSGDSVKSFSFPILANGMRSGSLKAGVEQQQKQQHLESHPAPVRRVLLSSQAASCLKCKPELPLIKFLIIKFKTGTSTMVAIEPIRGLLNMQLLSISTVLGVATWKLVLCNRVEAVDIRSSDDILRCSLIFER
ncbi:hypothetical protein OIU77_013882 [Salix suchowensis]|uniref:Uncharacterized protein n=1 Tax=Salix suchowensis TaxID=1278906 RepID=A0ABQ8ZW43_9ROSI|nr:hypothetical protein OIU77_013882 [Salix suchowensis]